MVSSSLVAAAVDFDDPVIIMKTYGPNTKHQTRNTKHKTQNTKHEILDTKHKTPLQFWSTAHADIRILL